MAYRSVVNRRASPMVIRPTVRCSIIMHFYCFSFKQALCVLIVASYLLWALCSKMLTSHLSCSLCIAVSELVWLCVFSFGGGGGWQIAEGMGRHFFVAYSYCRSLWLQENLAPEVYDYKEINEDGIIGSCPTFKTRKDITGDVRDGDYGCLVSYSDAMERSVSRYFTLWARGNICWVRHCSFHPLPRPSLYGHMRSNSAVLHLHYDRLTLRVLIKTQSRLQPLQWELRTTSSII